MELIRLSPSRINDYLQCPKLYFYRVVAQLPEPLNIDAVRGTLIHRILERLLALPAAERTLERAKTNAPSEWSILKEQNEEVSKLIESEAEWFARINSLLENYFLLEDPSRFEPTHIEAHLELEPVKKLQLHGYVDRIDIAATGEVRIVDYKTGKSPKSGYEDKALFQLRFYALLWFRLHGQIPRLLQLLFLADQRSLRNEPTEIDLVRTEERVFVIGSDIETSFSKDYWPTKRSKLCSWCSFQSICPEFVGPHA